MWLTYKELIAFYGFSRRTAINKRNEGEWPVAEVKNPRGGRPVVFMFVKEANQSAIFEDNGVDRSQRKNGRTGSAKTRKSMCRIG